MTKKGCAASSKGLRLWRGSKGASLLDYGMLAGLLALGSIGAVVATGGEVRTIFCVASQSVATMSVSEAWERCDAGIPVAEAGGGAGGGENSPGAGSPQEGEDSGGGEGVDAGGGEGVGAGAVGTDENPATSPESVVLSFSNVTLKAGSVQTYATQRTGRVLPSPGYLFRVESLAEGGSVGTYAACLGAVCAPSTPSGVSEVAVPASETFRVGYRFAPTSGSLDALDVPLRLSLVSAADSSQSWSQTVQLRRAASTIGVASFAMDDVVIPAGSATVTSAFVRFTPEGEGTWTAVLRPLEGSAPSAGMSYTLLTSSGNTTGPLETGDGVLTFARSAASGLRVQMRPLSSAQRFEAITRGFDLVLTSVEDPSVQVSQSFQVTRAAADAAFPKVAVSDLTLASGRHGVMLAPFSYTGDENSTLTVEVVDAEGAALGAVGVDSLCTLSNSSCTTVWNAANPVMSINLGARKFGRIGISVPGGNALFSAQRWTLRLTVMSAFDPQKSSVTEFVVSRPASAQSVSTAQFSDIVLTPGQTSFSEIIQPTGLPAPVRATTEKKEADSSLSLTLCLKLSPAASVYDSCQTGAQTTLSVLGSTYQAASRTTNVGISGTIAPSALYSEIDVPVDVSLMMEGASDTMSTQTIRIRRPAISVDTPEFVLDTPRLYTETTGTQTVPFTARGKDQMLLSMAHVAGPVLDVKGRIGTGNYASPLTFGTFNMGNPVYTGNLSAVPVGVTTSQENWMDYKSTYDLTLAPKGPDGFDATKAQTVRVDFERMIPAPTLSGVPAVFTLNASGGSASRTTTPYFAFTKPNGATFIRVTLTRVSGSSTMRASVCMEGSSCMTEAVNSNDTKNTSAVAFRFSSTAAAGTEERAVYEVRVEPNGYYEKPSLYRMEVVRPAS